MRSVESSDGKLQVESADGPSVFELGAQAEKWAHKILHPKSLFDKLGVKPGMRLAVVGIDEPGFLDDLRSRANSVASLETSSSARPTSASGRAGSGVVEEAKDGGYDAVFLAVDGQADLDRLAGLKRAIKPDGAVWAVFRKGGKDPSTGLRTGFNENTVLRGGLAAGLVDVKVVRFSETHTASKFVIRKAERNQTR